MYYLYAIRNENSIVYIGHTNNLSRRFAEHNTNKSPYTKGRGPWKLVYTELYRTRGEAMKREKFLKSGKGRELLKYLINLASIAIPEQ